MFRKKRETAVQEDPAEKSRCVVLYIKTTNLFEWNAQAGDRITQIACVELIDGKLTNNSLHLYLNPGSPELLKHCDDHYRENLSADKANALIKKMHSASSFKDAQATLLNFLGDPATTTILVHSIKRVLDFIRHELDEPGKAQFAKHREGMVDLISKCSKFSGYHAGQYADKIDTNKEVFTDKRRLYQLDYILDDLSVPNARNRDRYDAKQEALLVAKADLKLKTLVATKPKPAEDNIKRLKK